MQAAHTIQTDKKQRIILHTSLLYAEWQVGAARAGGKAAFEVVTALAGEGAQIEVTAKSSSGKTIGKIKDKITRNRFAGAFDIPEKMKPGDEIFFKVKLPRHGLQMESNSIPVRPQIVVQAMQWDRQEVHRGDEVTLTMRFESGVDNDQEAVIYIYELNSSDIKERVTEFHPTIRNNEIKIVWEFRYWRDTSQIPTEAELQPGGKHYAPPRYFFVAVIDGEKVGVNRESGVLTFRDAIALNATIGPNIAAGFMLEVALPDGTIQNWQTDAEGNYVTQSLPPGPLVIQKAQPGSSQSLRQQPDIGIQLAKVPYRISAAPWGQETMRIPLNTGEYTELQLQATALLVDAHFHIQSNNCCPLPLQWALVAAAFYNMTGGLVTPTRTPKDRVSLSDVSAGIASIAIGRLGKIGRLSTDLVARIFMGQAVSAQINTATTSVLLKPKEFESLTESQRKERAAKKANLEELSGEMLEDFTDNFIAHTNFYYKNTALARMQIALPMDMTFGQFWGQFRIPLYCACSDAIYYPNDFIQITITRTPLLSACVIETEFGAFTPGHRTNECIADGTTYRDTIHLFAQALANDNQPYKVSLLNELDHYEACQRLAKQNVKPTGRFVLFFDKPNPDTRALAQKKFVHFVAPVPLENDIRFEDWLLQKMRTECSAIEFPLQIIPFYHFDPRRHYDPTATSIAAIAGNIVQEHAFFTCRHDASKRVEYHDGLRQNGGLVVEPHPSLNTSADFETLLKQRLIGLPEVYSSLFGHASSTNGLFWGIKMYPLLGYAPDDFKTYPHLVAFYKTCIDCNLPITTHSSRGGMQIADYFNFQRYQQNLAQPHYDLKQADMEFADKYAAPKNWENVLTYQGANFTKLKLCLAHFGGYDNWKECRGFEKLETDPKADSGKKSLYNQWISKIVELIDRYDNVYTDMSYFLNPDPSWFQFDRNDIAKDLVYLLKKHAGLKDRLLMGSDWYMIEKEGSSIMKKFKGVGAYYRKMFLMLQAVSKEVNYDAWHQFAVVNPLRYLGLIDEKKGGKGPFEIKVERMEKFTWGFEAYWENKKWRDKGNFTGKKKQLMDNINALLTQFQQNSKILDSSEIKIDQKLLITSE
jgi:hypothetical protein